MDAQITLLEVELVPAQNLHKLRTCCGSWQNDKKQWIGFTVLEGLKQREIHDFTTTYLQRTLLSLRHLGP